MSIELARQIAGALGIRSEDKIRTINAALTAYVRLTPQSPVTQVGGSIDASQVSTGTFVDARIAESNVTQHEDALEIDWTQLLSIPSEFTPEDHLTHSTWTPTDQSGAALTFASASGIYTLHEDLLFARGVVQWPATADTNNAVIGGLPFATVSGTPNRQGWLTYGTETTARYIVPNNAATTAGIYQASGGGVQNAALSGDTLYFALLYRATLP